MRWRSIILAAWSALTLFGSGSATRPGLAQKQRADAPEASYVHDRWQTAEGLPHGAVTALHQARDGYLWVGTAAGLARFDGLQFVLVVDDQAPHLEHSYIWALHEDADSTLWIGSGNGLTRHSRGAFTTYAARDGLPVDFVRTLARDQDGRLWVGTYGGGLCHYEPPLTETAFTCYGTADGLPVPFVNALWIDQAGVLWVGTDAGLSRYEGGRFVPAVTDASFRPDVKALLGDTGGTLWLGTGSGLYRLQDGRPEPVHADGASVGAVRVLFQDAAGVLWVGTESNGLFAYRDGRFRHFQAGRLLSHGDVRALAQDREGSLWIGPMAAGWTGCGGGACASTPPRRHCPRTS